MIINRVWAMPNKWTFKIKPIAELLKRYNVGKGWIDPFAGMYSPAYFRNDLNPKANAQYNLPAYDFVLHLKNRYSGCLFDPPYSLRQIKECYDKIGYVPNKDYTLDASFSEVKDIIENIIKVNGYVISFGWNSNGFGKQRGFEIKEILLVPHGGHHYDTIVTVEQKVRDNYELF